MLWICCSNVALIQNWYRPFVWWQSSCDILTNYLQDIWFSETHDTLQTKRLLDVMWWVCRDNVALLWSWCHASIWGQRGCKTLINLSTRYLILRDSQCIANYVAVCGLDTIWPEDCIAASTFKWSGTGAQFQAQYSGFMPKGELNPCISSRAYSYYITIGFKLAMVRLALPFPSWSSIPSSESASKGPITFRTLLLSIREYISAHCLKMLWTLVFSVSRMSSFSNLSTAL